MVQFDAPTWVAIALFGYSCTVPLARALMLECNPSTKTYISLVIGAIFTLMTHITASTILQFLFLALTMAFTVYTYMVELHGPTPPVVDMRQKTIIVTGANSGIGFSTTKQLCQMGALVIMGCRSIERSKPMMDEVNNDVLVKKNGGKAVLLNASLDLNSLNSVRKWVAALNEAGYTTLDSLVCNAGLFVPNLQTHFETINSGKKNEEKIELEDSFVSNHLGHHLLMHLLLPSLHQAAMNRKKNIGESNDGKKIGVSWGSSDPSRIVLVSSSLHKLSSLEQGQYQYLDWYKGSKDKNSKKPTTDELKSNYNQWLVYGTVKLAEMLSAMHLERLIKTDPQYSQYKETIHINTLHPGNPVTNVTQNLPTILRFLEKMFYPMMFLWRQTCTLGAYNTVWVTTHPNALQGQNQYYVHMEPSKQNPAVYDKEAAKRIYEYSEYLCQE